MQSFNDMNNFFIGSRLIGMDQPPLVVAEIGINHGGSLSEAKKIVDAAVNAGAEVIKHQTHIADDEMSFEAQSIIPSHVDKSIYEVIKNSSLNEQDEFKLMKYVQKQGAIFISTPFSRLAADRLATYNVPAFKIGSGECNNYLLVEHIAKFGKPVILSTGMNSVETIRPSVEIFRKAGIPFALLHCTNIYPTPPELVRLGALQILKKEFPDAVIGLSDHTDTVYTCLGAVALGASILEKHFTDSLNRIGPDISSSMDPVGLKNLIEGSRIIHAASGGTKEPIAEESNTMSFAFSSVVAVADIEIGESFTKNNIWVKRPGGGDYSVHDYKTLIGKTALNKIRAGYQLKRADVSE